jgi:DNA-binding NarL/FixJ family response regulator
VRLHRQRADPQHFENIFEKLGVSDRTAAVAESIRSGLID